MEGQRCTRAPGHSERPAPGPWPPRPGHGLALRGGGGGGGGMAAWAPAPEPPPPNMCPLEENEFYRGGSKLEVDFGYTTFFVLASDPLPPRKGKIRH